jgi:hypothetical protein
VWSWHPLLVSSLRRRSRPDRARTSHNPPMTVTKGIRSPGRARRKPLKPLRAGMPGDSGGPVATTLVCSLHHLHARLRVQRAPGIPHALSFEGSVHARLGRIAPRGRGPASEVVRLSKFKSGICTGAMGRGVGRQPSDSPSTIRNADSRPDWF